MVFVTTFLIGKILRFNDFEISFKYEKVKGHRLKLLLLLKLELNYLCAISGAQS